MDIASLGLFFGFYGLVRKMLAVGPLVGLFWECLWLTPLALLYIFVLLPQAGNFLDRSLRPRNCGYSCPVW